MNGTFWLLPDFAVGVGYYCWLASFSFWLLRSIVFIVIRLPPDLPRRGGRDHQSQGQLQSSRLGPTGISALGAPAPGGVWDV